MPLLPEKLETMRLQWRGLSLEVTGVYRAPVRGFSLFPDGEPGEPPEREDFELRSALLVGEPPDLMPLFGESFTFSGSAPDSRVDAERDLVEEILARKEIF